MPLQSLTQRVTGIALRIRSLQNITKTMIVLIAPEKDIPNEIEILNQLFEEGLQYYHFRKPEKNYDEHVCLFKSNRGTIS